jgi:2-keto-4-pentenoate hydratase/2-oxohepta-3-ene-1,7-dioic acid hydratase in catechol pathway
MRLGRYRDGDRVRVGVLDGEELFELEGVSVVELLACESSERQRRMRRARANRRAVPVAAASLAEPVERPGKFLGVGFNFADHAAETPTDARPELARIYESIRYTRLAHPEPRLPVLFNKQITCITGPRDPVWLPRDATMVDYEGELAVVIGRAGRRLSAQRAAQCIAGYTVCNDVSVREWQVDTPTMWPGKSFDTHGPLGPWVVTADEVDPSALAIRTWVNGELRQDGSTADMVLGVAELISLISQVVSLEPGDVIATGTPAGIGTPSGRFLRAGDVVRVQVEGVGTIENEVVPEPLEQRSLLPSGNGAAARL